MLNCLNGLVIIEKYEGDNPRIRLKENEMAAGGVVSINEMKAKDRIQLDRLGWHIVNNRWTYRK